MITSKFHPKVSIVIPVYNGSNYLREAIESALAQTYDNFEVIVVNDGSRDNGATEAIAMSYGARILYFSKENGGCASALNMGIANMRGDYFSWLSHDDVYFPEKIEHQVRILSELPDKGTILYGGYEIIDAQSKPVTTVRPDAIHPADQLDIPLFPLLRGLLHGCSMLIPARYFCEIGVFDESRPSTQDYALWFEFLRVAPLHYDSHILIRSRVHPDQGTRKIAKHVEECNALWCGFLKELTPDEMAAIEGTTYRFLVKTAQFLANTPYKQAEKLAAAMAGKTLGSTLISVIIPFHNRIEWTVEAIRSVQGQTHQSFQIILVDDGSTDCLDPLHEFLRNDPRIVYVRQDHSGPAKARNAGVAWASGKYIAFLDSDDMFLSDKLETQLRFMEENDLSLSHTSYERVDVNGTPLGFRDSGTFSGTVFPRIIASCPIAMPTVMGKADLFRKYPFPEHLDIGEDVCLWITLCSKYELGGIDKALSKVRVGPETAATNPKKQVIGLINIASYVSRDPHLIQYGKQLRLLLSSASGLLPNVNGADDLITRNADALLPSARGVYVHAPRGKRASRFTSVLPLFLAYLRRNGVRATLKRIALELGLT